MSRDMIVIINIMLILVGSALCFGGPWYFTWQIHVQEGWAFLPGIWSAGITGVGGLLLIIFAVCNIIDKE